jgi:hypothetical protein
MKKPRYSDSQILAILKQAEGGKKWTPYFGQGDKCIPPLFG